MGSLLLALFIGPFCFSAPSKWTIDDLILKTQNESEIAKASTKTIQSIELEIEARDLVLGFQLAGEAAIVKDYRDQIAFAQRSKYDTLLFNLTKPFSTGTTLLLTGSHDNSTYSTFGKRYNEYWEVRVTQSLWRDFFGRATALRHQGEKAELTSRKAQAYYELQTFLVGVEDLFWDLSLALREQDIRLRNIENGKRLEVWTKKRFSNSAAEKSDLFQSQALVSQATLDAISAQNQIENLKNQLRKYFPNLTNEALQADVSSLEKERSITDMIVHDGSGNQPRRLDSLAATYLANQAEIEAKKVQDSLKPRVDLYASYGQNGIAPQYQSAWERAQDSDHNISRIGVQFTVDLNRGLVANRVRSAQLAAEARALQAQSQNRTSLIGWEEVVRQVSLLKEQSKEADRLASLQSSKVIEERKRFQLGRSTVFQLVTYELDAANAELNKYRTLAALRKAESQARLFTTMDGGVK